MAPKGSQQVVNRPPCRNVCVCVCVHIYIYVYIYIYLC